MKSPASTLSCGILPKAFVEADQIPKNPQLTDELIAAVPNSGIKLFHQMMATHRTSGGSFDLQHWNYIFMFPAKGKERSCPDHGRHRRSGSSWLPAQEAP